VTVYPQILQNVRVADKESAQKNPAVLKAVEEAEKSLNGDGRILLRASGTEPRCARHGRSFHGPTVQAVRGGLS
jgi:phosphomannomutase